MTTALHEPSAVERGRRVFRRRQTSRSVVIAVVSTIVFAGLAWLAIINTAGWGRVQHSFFDPAVLAQAWPRVIAGLWLNIRVLFFAALGVLVLSIILAILRTLRGPIFFPVRALVAGYTDLFRGLPLIIVLYLVGFGIPGLRLDIPRFPAEF